MKYVDTQVTFSEVPNEISLCINISNCPCHCKNCHSSYLAEDIGNLLDAKELSKHININRGITCVCLMGGDATPNEVNKLAKTVKLDHPNLKVAWYSGKQELSKGISLSWFDYIKLGPYKEELGGLTSRKTNQRFYKVTHTSAGISKLYDMTHQFWKK